MTNYPLDLLRKAAYILVGMLLTPKKTATQDSKVRDPEGTRQRLLRAAFREVYRYEFQSAGIDANLAAGSGDSS